MNLIRRRATPSTPTDWSDTATIARLIRHKVAVRITTEGKTPTRYTGTLIGHRSNPDGTHTLTLEQDGGRAHIVIGQGAQTALAA